MNPMPNRLYLPKHIAESYPPLSWLERQGLPSSARWRFHSSGPEYQFDFTLLPLGGTRFEQTDIERFQLYSHDMREMLRIGNYTYTFLDLQQQSDLCVRTNDGSLWIINPKWESIVTRIDGNDIVSERIPFFVQFVNSQPDRFENCLNVFLQLVERFRQPPKNKDTVRSAWTQFEEYIRETDPQAVDIETSFWLCVIGERLGPY